MHDEESFWVECKACNTATCVHKDEYYAFRATGMCPHCIKRKHALDLFLLKNEHKLRILFGGEDA